MTLDELLEQFRRDVDDTVAPYLWADDDFYRWLDDAQSEFCRRAYGISDASSDITAVTVSAGEAFADVDPSILQFRRASLRSTGKPLTIVNFEEMDNPGVPSLVESDYGLFVPGQSTLLDTTQGTVWAMVIGMEEDKVRWVHVPSVADTVDLIVYRLPLTSVAGGSGELEIAERHHLGLLDWVKYRAYGKQDAETYDAARAKDFFAAFRNYCAESKADWERKKHKPRTVVYGGI